MEYEVKYTEVFEDWLRGLRDLRAAMKITARIRRVELGNFGGSKSVGSGVSELRVDIGKGYRVYYTIRRTNILREGLSREGAMVRDAFSRLVPVG